MNIPTAYEIIGMPMWLLRERFDYWVRIGRFTGDDSGWDAYLNWLGVEL